MAPFADAAPLVDAARVVDGVWQVPEGWHQGRGAWGGLVVAAAIRACSDADAAESGDRPVREVSAHIAAPVPAGPASVTAALVRRGSATAVWQAVIGAADPQAPATWATSTVVFGAARAADMHPTPALVMPTVTPWPDLDAVELGPPIAPEFLQHLSVRPISGFPYSAGSDDVVAWVTPAIAPTAYDAATLVGMVDAMWPAALVQIDAPRPMATLSFSATLLVDPRTVDPGEPLLHRGRLLAAVDGYATETRELWTPDGRLAVHNTQVVAVIR